MERVKRGEDLNGLCIVCILWMLWMSFVCLRASAVYQEVSAFCTRCVEINTANRLVCFFEDAKRRKLAPGIDCVYLRCFASHRNWLEVELQYVYTHIYILRSRG